MFEKHQERLPPALLADSGLLYDELPWAAPFSVQAQLKRLADLLVAGALLLLTAPFVALAALLIWLEDQGPVFYSQQRSGWLGRPFTVLKLRTMREQPKAKLFGHSQAISGLRRWASCSTPAPRRITLLLNAQWRNGLIGPRLSVQS